MNIQPKTIASLAKEVENIVVVKVRDLSQVANIIYESEGESMYIQVSTTRQFQSWQ